MKRPPDNHAPEGRLSTPPHHASPDLSSRHAAPAPDAGATKNPRPHIPQAVNKPATQSHKPEPPRKAGFDPLGGVLAFALPGLGHISQGRRSRGLGVMAGVLGLFFGGMLLGGVTVVDRASPRVEQKLSFYGQAMVGPVTFFVDWLHQTRFKGDDPDRRVRRHAGPNETIKDGVIVPAGEGEGPPVVVSVGKVNDLGVLAGLLAGMLNLIAILDALLPDLAQRKPPRTPSRSNAKPGAPPRRPSRSDPDTLRTTGVLDAIEDEAGSEPPRSERSDAPDSAAPKEPTP